MKTTTLGIITTVRLPHDESHTERANTMSNDDTNFEDLTHGTAVDRVMSNIDQEGGDPRAFTIILAKDGFLAIVPEEDNLPEPVLDARQQITAIIASYLTVAWAYPLHKDDEGPSELMASLLKTARETWHAIINLAKSKYDEAHRVEA